MRLMSLDVRAHNMQTTTPLLYISHAWVLTDFAKLKKLLVSPVTMLDEPENGRFPKSLLMKITIPCYT